MRLVLGLGLPRVALDVHEQKLLEARGCCVLGLLRPVTSCFFCCAARLSGGARSIIGTSLGLDVEVRVYPDGPAVLAALRVGEVDIQGRGTSYEAQFADLWLSQAYTFNQPVLVSKSADLVHESRSSCGLLTAVEGYAAADELRRRFPNTQLSRFRYQRTVRFYIRPCRSIPLSE